MKIEYGRQAITDLRKIAADRRAFGERVAPELEQRIRTVIANIAQHPKAATPVLERPGMRVVPLVRYPY